MRTIVVTGAATGIGRAAATAFHTRGDYVVLTGRRADALTKAVDGLDERAVPVAFDASDPDQVTAALSQLPDRIDVLVNNAGGNTDFDHDDPTDLAGVAAAWRANLEANLLSAVLVTTALRDRLQPGGTVVNIGSIAADKGAGAYGAAKAGLASWTVDLAAQLSPTDITVNTLAPGYVADTEFFRDKLSDDTRQTLVDSALTRRASHPEDIAATVEFLASPGARQITGQVLAVNGGERTSR
ncbi:MULTISPECIES: SDR family NAD(P)-dependent oxidoreductase [Pseudonocardia]|uniref:SDR family NAD(P)-dependent oxidoreductase n=1 Tax=Pseudonocardia TaxID=1847 RepID=UPI001C4A742B|nr:SDR family oxidoreductase [Pseudonocardia sp. KRD291]MBW0105278.1 SDR family oxidoreductase [Pseudonocardia sp. KRD291]